MTTTDSVVVVVVVVVVTLTVTMDTVLAEKRDHDPIFGISDGAPLLTLQPGNQMSTRMFLLSYIITVQLVLSIHSKKHLSGLTDNMYTHV